MTPGLNVGRCDKGHTGRSKIRNDIPVIVQHMTLQTDTAIYSEKFSHIHGM